MHYLTLLKKAYQTTLKHKFLWIYGIFVASVTGVYMGGNNFSEKDWKDLPFQKEQVFSFFEQHATILAWSAFGFVLLLMICGILSLISQGALISAGAKLNKDEKTDFHSSLEVGLKHFWRVWGLGIILCLLGFTSLIVLLLPLLFFLASKLILLAMVLVVPSILLFIGLTFVLSAAVPYAVRILVLEDKSIFESVASLIKFAIKNIKQVILTYLILIATKVVFAIAFMATLLLTGLLLVGIGMAIWSASAQIGVIYAVIMSIIYVLATMVVLGAYKAFQSVFLTFVYEKLK
ncbi:MAG: hypothetical protein WCP93_03245 [Candidatus Berkelbacteria bacterium]